MVFALIALLFYKTKLKTHFQDTSFKPRYSENAQFNNCRLVDNKYKCTEK